MQNTRVNMRPAVALLLAWLSLQPLLHAKLQSSPASLVCPVPELSTLPTTLRAEVNRLTTDEPGARANAAAMLGAMGVRAAPSVPWLLLAVDDTRPVVSLKYGRVTVGFVAGRALSDIGKPAIDCVSSRLVSPGLGRDELKALFRAAGIMRVSEMLDLLLRQPESVYPTGAEPDDALASQLTETLVCFLPDVRVGDALLRLAASAERARKSNGGALIYFNSATDGSLNRTLADATRWWETNRPATLKPLECDAGRR